LRDRLAKEGLFAENLKKPLPALPATVGIVTSPTGAAIHDILNIIGRRYATLHILIAPVKVQGEGAAVEIAAAIADLNSCPGIDVIIVARGGGSIEDLWAFNEEVVARAIFASKMPVISAVGHEVDVTIADLVADLRAPTPSAAAELVVNSKAQLSADCDALNRRLLLAIQRKVTDAAAQLEILKLSLKNPEIVIERFMQRLDDLQSRAESVLEHLVSEGLQRVNSTENRLFAYSPGLVIRNLQADLENYLLRIKVTLQAKVEFSRSSLAEMGGRLEALSPLATLMRGYAAVYKPFTGVVVNSISQLTAGENIAVRFVDGVAACQVEQLNDLGPYNLDSNFREN